MPGSLDTGAVWQLLRSRGNPRSRRCHGPDRADLSNYLGKSNV